MRSLSLKQSMKSILKFIILGLFVLMTKAGMCGTIFDGELHAHFASPVGAKFIFKHNGQFVSQNQDGFIDFGDLAYNSNIGLWAPTVCSQNVACYSLDISMEPFKVMGNFGLTFQYSNTNNPNAQAGAPFSQRGGLGKKVAMTAESCKVFAPYTCSDLFNLGGPNNVDYAVLLDQINYANGYVGGVNTTDYFRLNFFVNLFDPSMGIWSILGGPNGGLAEAFTNLDHSGEYTGTLTITATYN